MEAQGFAWEGSEPVPCALMCQAPEACLLPGAGGCLLQGYPCLPVHHLGQFPLLHLQVLLPFEQDPQLGVEVLEGRGREEVCLGARDLSKGIRLGSLMILKRGWEAEREAR